MRDVMLIWADSIVYVLVRSRNTWKRMCVLRQHRNKGTKNEMPWADNPRPHCYFFVSFFVKWCQKEKRKKREEDFVCLGDDANVYVILEHYVYLIEFFGLLPPLTFENKIKQSCSTHKTHTTAPCWSKTDGWIRPKQNHPSLIPTRQPYGQLSIKSMNKKRSSDVHYNEQNEHRVKL